MDSNTEEFYRSIGVDKKKIDLAAYQKLFKAAFLEYGMVKNFCIIEYKNHRIVYFLFFLLVQLYLRLHLPLRGYI